jgi:hypothetical protein
MVAHGRESGQTATWVAKKPRAFYTQTIFSVRKRSTVMEEWALPLLTRNLSAVY